MPNSALLFTANDGTSGTELWVTDGTSPGTFLLKDINPGAGNSNPGFFVPLSTGSALFSANNGTDGPELWVSNGTPSGTTQIADIRPGSAGSNPAALTEFAPGRALFSADDGTHGSELWTTDGTAAGTSLIMDITPGATSGGPSGFMVLSPTQVLFGANDGIHGGELWTTDGTAAGTSMLAELRTGTSYGNPAGSYPGGGGVSLGNGKAVFTANNGANGRELWVSDGTVGGTALLADIIPGAVSSYPNALTPIGNGLALFTVNDGTHDTELWVTDGTVPGTHLLKDINTHPVDNVHYFNTSSYPRSITAVGNGLALFRANDVTHGYELWITDGTEIGTTMVADINGGALDSKPGNFVEASNGVYLMRAAGPASYGFELWRTDGTEAGTTQVKESSPAPAVRWPPMPRSPPSAMARSYSPPATACTAPSSGSPTVPAPIPAC
ncbi:MAG: hypothetical protein NT133_00170 [Alphaproteobacteria bacterium]|nr:hypothetical protein [Alphaproteobacteria bacterium]